MVTNMTAARGIGNRPGRLELFSAARSSPTASGGWRCRSGRTRAASSTTPSSCRTARRAGSGFTSRRRRASRTTAAPLMPSEVNVDAITCPTRFTSAKGKLDASTKSYYPPRNDLTTFGTGTATRWAATLPGCTVSAMSYADAERSGRGRGGDAGLRRRPTRAPGRSRRRFPPATTRCYVEVNKEFDNNASHSHPSYEGSATLRGTASPTTSASPPSSIGSRSTSTRAAGVAARATMSQIDGYSDWTGEDGAIIPRDATISTTNPGSGEARLLDDRDRRRPGPGARRASSRAARPRCAPPPPRARRGDRRFDRQMRARLADTLGRGRRSTHAQAERRRGRQLRDRYREGAPMSDEEFVEAIRAPLVAPGAPGIDRHVTLSGLKPATRLRGGRARGGRLRADLAHRDRVAFRDPAHAVQAGRGLLRRDRCLGIGAGLAGRRRCGGPRDRLAAGRASWPR